MSKTFVAPWRLLLVAMVVVVGFGAVLARLALLHVVQREELSAYARGTRALTVAREARRGDITDARGNLLATTRPRIRLGIDPQVFNPEATGRLYQLANELGLPAREILERVLAARQRADRPVRWIKLAEIDPDLYEQIKLRKISGVYGNLYYERYYPAASFASHVIGYLNRENDAVLGVEQYLDFYLRGQPGWRETEADVHRREMAQFRSREVDPRAGYNVELTIDLVVQSYVEEALAHLVEKYAPQGASIIVSDPMTGEILGLGNYPNFDPNRFWEYDVAAQRNRAVTDLLEPGSTFKIVPVAGALEERLVNPQTTIDCSIAAVDYKGRHLRLPTDDHPLERIAVAEVVAKSSNRGVAQLGLMLGEDRLYDYSRRFGFGERTDWGLLGEVRGTVHPVKDWDGLTITRMPAGYALNATPMQVHFAMSAIANGGQLLTPRVVRRVSDERGRTVVAFPPQHRGQVVSPESARMVAAMLTRVATEDGTARRAAIPGFQVAGKTGTTRKTINGQYSQQHHFASFSGFFPATAPRFAITVVVDDAQLPGPAYGGVVAAPAFREIGERLIEYFAVAPVRETPDGLLAFLGGNGR